MREIGLGKGGACLYRDNDERMDPDRDFSHIDKRIQDVLGQYQKDFMGEVSADNLGARWGGYGSFLPVTRCSSVPTITRPQTNISSRSHNSTKEVHQNVTIQANESIHVRPRPGIPPLSGQSTSTLENAVDVRSSGDALIKNQPKAIPPDLSDNNVSKLISDNAVDNSAIYSGLGLDMSPSSSFEESPLNIDRTPPHSQRLPDKSPSHIIKVMTSLPVPGGKLLSPLSERFVFLANKEIKQDRILPRVETSMQIEHELFSSEGKMTVLKERKVKQNNKSKVSEFEGGNCEDLPSITGHPSKRMEDSKMSRGKEINTGNPVDTNFMHRDKKGTSTCMENDDISTSSYALSKRNGVALLVDAVPKSQKLSYVKEELPEQVDSPASPVSTDFIRLDKKSSSTFMEKDNISRASYPPSKRNGVAKSVDSGAKYQKQSHVKEETPSDQVESLASLVSPFEEKEISAGFSGKIQRDMNVTSVIKSDTGNDNVSQKGHGNRNSKKSSREPKTKVKEELPEPFSSQDVGLQNVMLVRGDTDKSRKQQRKMKNEAIMLPDSTLENAGASLERTTDIFMEKIHNDRKPSSIASITGKDLNDKKQLRNEEFDNSLGRNNLDGAKAEPVEESSSAKNLSQSQMRANLKGKKERLSSESKKKARKSQEGIQASLVLPKVSFKVGSSAAFSQQTDCGSDELRKVKDRSSDVTSNATPKKKEKVTATKDPIVGVAKREKHALGSQQKDKPDSSQYQHPSSTGLVPRADPIDNAYSMEKAPTSGAVPTETAPVVIQEDWVQCDKCQTWRLLPHNIKPDDLPKRWLCSMLNWLPSMNKCSFTEEQTRDALRALYQLPPAVNNAQIPQTYPNRGPPVVVAADKQPVGMTMPVTGIDPLPETVKRVAKQEVQVESKMDQLPTVESGKKQKPIQSRSGPSKQVVVIGKKREGSKDAHGALKKVKRESQQFDKDQNCIVPLMMETGNAILNDDPSSSQVPKDPVMDKPNNYSKKLKEKSQRTVTKEDERKDISARKRKSRDSSDGPVATEIPSSEVPFKERGNDPRREKRQKLEPNLQEKESSTTRSNGKNDVGDQDNVSCGGSSQKSGRREDRLYRNTSKTADGRKLSRSDPELKMPALAAATSSSSKISSTCRVKVKSQAKCSPVGSISSSPMRVSRSNHDRSRDQFSTPNIKQDFSTTKNKNLEARNVVPNMAHHYEERTERKSEKGTDSGVQFHPVQEDGVVKQIGIKFKEEDDSSRRKSVNVKGLDKTISDNMLPERFRPKQDQAGSSRDHPSSSTKVLDFGKIVGFNAMASHDDSKGKPPSQQGCGKLIADDVRPSSSVRKDNFDRAARTALREAKDLKHSADRLKINGSGLSTEVFFQAALKFLNGASLLEFDNAEGSGSSDMKPSEVYRSTAKLCIYCAREFEKLNDMASAALAYKCMEVAYMRVVYYSDVVASRDRHELQLAQTEVPQVVESPSSSASDVDNVNNPTPNGMVVRATQTSAVHGNYVISADNRPSFDRLLNFAEDVNLAMDAARKSQNAFAVARSTLRESGNEDSITAIKRVLDFSFHDVDELLYLVRLAMEAIPNR